MCLKGEFKKLFANISLLQEKIMYFSHIGLVATRKKSCILDDANNFNLFKFQRETIQRY